MSDTASLIGFSVIVVIYASVGAFTVVGSAMLTRKLLAPKWEQVFYAGFLMAIAAFYLAFAAYFGAKDAWPTESAAVLAFCVIALIGIRWTFALMLGYVLHGVWDLLHELQAHDAVSVFQRGQATDIPLAYGVFCATYDIGIAIYFHLRRAEWRAAWQLPHSRGIAPASDSASDPTLTG